MKYIALLAEDIVEKVKFMKMVNILANRDYVKEIQEIFDKQRDEVIKYYKTNCADLDTELNSKYGNDLISFLQIHIDFPKQYMEYKVKQIKADLDTSIKFTEKNDRLVLESSRLVITFYTIEKYIRVEEKSLKDNVKYGYCITKKKRNLKKAWEEIKDKLNNKTNVREVINILRKYDLVTD